MTIDGLDKIRLKGGPKQYKRAPGPSGRARFEQRLARLTIDLDRFGRRPDNRDAAWARAWIVALQTTRRQLHKDDDGED